MIGFDDIEEAALWRPALTTISIAPSKIGLEAAQLLLERIANPDDEPRQVVLAPRLVTRASCGRHQNSTTITGNNVNYYEHADVLSDGVDSVAGHNAGYKGKPYQSGDSAGTVVQSFEAELTERLIRELM